MKKAFFITSFCLVCLSAFTTSCSGAKKENSEQKVADQYQCPMKCTEEVFDKPGKCPVCEMDLEKINNS